MNQGGGFMPGSQNGSPGTKTQKNHTYRPVTIKQLLEADQPHPDADFKIDDVDLDHVTLVAVITNMARGQMNLSLTVEDGTGSIDVRLWLETADDDSGKMEGIDQGVYVRIIGTMKSFNHKRSVNATVLKKVEDFNEINYHLLQVVYVHLYHTRGGPPQQTTGGQSAMQGVQRAQGNQQKAAGMDAYNASTSAGNVNKWKDLKPNEQKIMVYIEKIGYSNLPDEGLNLNEIARSVPGLTYEKVQAAVEDMMSEGLLYTTSDSEHVLPTAMD